jgi:hypothetical protein
MDKVRFNVKDYFIIIISLAALFVSFRACQEANFANKLNIDPVITFGYETFQRDNTDRIEFFIVNEGEIDVKKIQISWAIAYMESEKDVPHILSSGRENFTDYLEAGYEKPYRHDISHTKELMEKAPGGLGHESWSRDTLKENFIIEKGKAFIFGLKAKYRRTSDSRLYEKISYFLVLLTPSEIHIDDIYEMPASYYKEILKKCEENFPF